MYNKFSLVAIKINKQIKKKKKWIALQFIGIKIRSYQTTTYSIWFK